jgi:hypothetical protein
MTGFGQKWETGDGNMSGKSTITPGWQPIRSNYIMNSSKPVAEQANKRAKEG